MWYKEGKIKMSNCPNCGCDWVYSCECTLKQINKAVEREDFWYRTKNLTMGDYKKIAKMWHDEVCTK